MADAKARYDAKNTEKITLKLNRKTDADILGALDRSKPIQTQIKTWIRQALNK